MSIIQKPLAALSMADGFPDHVRSVYLYLVAIEICNFTEFVKVDMRKVSHFVGKPLDFVSRGIAGLERGNFIQVRRENGQVYVQLVEWDTDAAPLNLKEKEWEEKKKLKELTKIMKGGKK
jgi:hypothetical protein